mmetsp:Transcript_17312/g.41729  ORF Transcript_17312/g.41729 Transcript_17312/m.41729 type:complete len:212 (-) Transcript_17312:208-843(-)
MPPPPWGVRDGWKGTMELVTDAFVCGGSAAAAARSATPGITAHTGSVASRCSMLAWSIATAGSAAPMACAVTPGRWMWRCMCRFDRDGSEEASFSYSGGNMLWSADPTTLSSPLLNTMLSKAFSSTSFRISSSSIESRTRLKDDRTPGRALRQRSRALIADRLILICERSIVGEKALATLMVLAMSSSVVLKVRARCLRMPCPIIAAGAKQ